MKAIAAIALTAGLAVSGQALAGDAAAGEAAFNGKGCVGCHGAGGASVVPTYPVLKGKDAAFLTEKLTGFKSGAITSATMNAMAATLSDDDIANIAAYLSAQ